MVPHISHWIKACASLPTKSLKNPHGIPLDLSYITDNLLCCSFPSSAFPRRFYRNDIEDLVEYLNLEHFGHWKIFNLRAQHFSEYDLNAENLKGRIVNYPWVDHEGLPFFYLIRVLDAIDQFICEDEQNVVVLHCRMGKGRSGLIAAAYLIYKKGLSKDAAEKEFTDKRMTTGFGTGVSIKSQLKYCEYMEMFCERNLFYHHCFTRNIKIVFSGARFRAVDDHVMFEIRGYDAEENYTDPVLMKDYMRDLEDGMVEAILPNSQIYTDIRVSLKMNNYVGITVSTVYLWFNLFFETKVSQHGVCFFTWEEFDGLKGTGKKGFRLFDQMELHLGI
jgi:protein-tyrosine phosphatase